MARARQTSFVDDVIEAWKEATEQSKKKDPAFPEKMEKLGQTVSMLASSYWVRHHLRKKGAPEWVAYGVSIIDLTLTQVVMRLYYLEKALAKTQVEEKEDVSDFRLNQEVAKKLTDLRANILKPREGETAAETLDRVIASFRGRKGDTE